MELRSSGLNRAKIFSKRLKIQFVFLVPSMGSQYASGRKRNNFKKIQTTFFRPV